MFGYYEFKTKILYCRAAFMHLHILPVKPIPSGKSCEFRWQNEQGYLCTRAAAGPRKVENQVVVTFLSKLVKKMCNNAYCACMNVNTRITRLNALCGIQEKILRPKYAGRGYLIWSPIGLREGILKKPNRRNWFHESLITHRSSNPKL